MNPKTKNHLLQGLAILGVTVITGTAYFAGTSGNNFQSQLVGENTVNELTLFDGNPLVVSDSEAALQATSGGTEAVSSVFDATPASNSGTSTVSQVFETGSTMSASGSALEESTTTEEIDELQKLVDLRPAAMEATNPLMEMFGGNTNSAGPEAQSSVVTSSAVTAADILKSATDSENTNANAEATQTEETPEEEAAKTALAQAPHVPQTGAETWLLSVSILCAMMGMTMLMTSPKQL